MNCPFCNSKKLYYLQNDYKKCSFCKKKFSIKKMKTDIIIIENFCNNINALQCSLKLKVNYRTIINRYKIYRKLIALYLEDEYNNQNNKESQYEEYYYFKERDINLKKRDISRAINIIGFYSQDKVYTLLMPKIKKNLLNTNEDIKQYQSWYKIHSRDAYKTKLNIFWKYMQKNLKKYKGIEEKYFFYYLKECEFKFNYLHNKQIEILKNLYFSK